MFAEVCSKVRNEAKVNTGKTLNHNWIISKCPHHFCGMIVTNKLRGQKQKQLEDKNKNTFFVFMCGCLSDEK